MKNILVFLLLITGCQSSQNLKLDKRNISSSYEDQMVDAIPNVVKSKYGFIFSDDGLTEGQSRTISNFMLIEHNEASESPVFYDSSKSTDGKIVLIAAVDVIEKNGKKNRICYAYELEGTNVKWGNKSGALVNGCFLSEHPTLDSTFKKPELLKRMLEKAESMSPNPTTSDPVSVDPGTSGR